MTINKNNLSRRNFLKASAVTGAVGTSALSIGAVNKASATEIAPQFQDVKTLKPGQQVIKGSVPAPPFAVLVLNKAGFGPRPGDIEAFNALGSTNTERLNAWIVQQLNPTASDPEVDVRVSSYVSAGQAYDTINKTKTQLWDEHLAYTGGNPDQRHARRSRPRIQQERLMILRAVYGKWQVREMLNDFWFNHFNVEGQMPHVRSLLPHYNEQIRTRMFGNFYDMLLANSKTVSMLRYLNNDQNSWPRPNENYAREVLELHTLGAVENYYGAVTPNSLGNNIKGQRTGYTEIDVFQFARALTGWSFDSSNSGAFQFKADKHYDEHHMESIRVMDRVISSPIDGDGRGDVPYILKYLANHYGTARYISWKLCVRFVSDNPPESLVASTANIFYNQRNNPDQLKKVYSHILRSTAFRTTWGEKIKRPTENVISAMRATDMDIDFRDNHGPSNRIFHIRLQGTGNIPYAYPLPTGYPDEKAAWSGSDALSATWHTITYFVYHSATILDGEQMYFNLVHQINAEIPNTANRTPTRLVDTWMLRLRGYAYDPQTRDLLIDFIVDLSGASANQSLHELINTNQAGRVEYQSINSTLVGLILLAPDTIRR